MSEGLVALASHLTHVICATCLWLHGTCKEGEIGRVLDERVGQQKNKKTDVTRGTQATMLQPTPATLGRNQRGRGPTVGQQLNPHVKLSCGAVFTSIQHAHIYLPSQILSPTSEQRLAPVNPPLRSYTAKEYLQLVDAHPTTTTTATTTLCVPLSYL
jgi:hypothetical protein